MVYAALLRGINVGGNNKVEMPRLKRIFEAAGCRNVSTYINSGNVIFSDDRPVSELVPILEKAIEGEFNLAVPVVLRNYENIVKLCEAVPADWTNDSAQKTDVLLLWEEIDDPSVTQKIVINPELENVLYVPGALVWNTARENVTKGNGVKLVKSDLYKYMTVRNINTVRKLRELMEKVS